MPLYILCYKILISFHYFLKESKNIKLFKLRVENFLKLFLNKLFEMNLIVKKSKIKKIIFRTEIQNLRLEFELPNARANNKYFIILFHVLLLK